MTNTTTLAVGDTVRALDEIQMPGQPRTGNPYPAVVGMLAEVTRVEDNVIDVKWSGSTADHGRNWGAMWFEKVEITELTAPEAFGRPLVHFDDEKAARDRSKARAAARLAVSRILLDEDNEVLRAAADGESVDAYALNRAVLAAMRSASTRLGQSTGRRLMATEFAHLGHIVQAVLENHADNLPGYGPGERSRVLEEVRETITSAKREIEHAGAVNQSLTQDLAALRQERSDLTQAASDERRRLCENIDTLRGNLSQTIREANEFEAALAYAKSMLTDEQAAQVEAFADGFRVGASD